MKQSASRSEKLQDSNEKKTLEADSEKRWAFCPKDDSSSSGSSVPDNLNLIDGEIEIIQRNKTLTEDDRISPGTALHKIKVNDRFRKLLAKCSTVSTDWAIELETSFFRGSQLLVRKVTPGSTFSHCYGNQGAFDRLVIRAHLTAKSGNTFFEGYFCRSQKLSNPLERSSALKKLEATHGRKNFKRFSDTSADSVPVIQQLHAGGDVPQPNALLFHHSLLNSGNQAALHGNTNLPSKGIPTLLSASGGKGPVAMRREPKEFNEVSTEEKRLKGVYSSPPATSKATYRTSGATNEIPPKVDLPDPKKVPKAVLDVCHFEDFLANKKVIDYLNHLDDGAAAINKHLENNIKVSEEDISSLNSATSAILREYGYDLPGTSRAKKHPGHYSRKTLEPRAETATTSESDVSDSELKSEVVKRAIEGKDFSELLTLLKNSKEWKESVEDDWRSGSGLSGKIERKIHHDHS